jgi:2-dehydropantoate 2-reductase
MLAMKSQHTGAALEALEPVMPPSTPVLCAQNGVSNEPAALRRFPKVYAVSVASPCGHLEPGVVQAYSSPTTGILDIGRFPSGADALAGSVAEALRASTFDSVVRPDVMAWKWAKLLLNLGNAIEAVCGPPARQSLIGERARAEGVACLRAAGIPFVSDAEDKARRGDLVRPRRLDGAERPGGSSWQSLARSTGDIEADYLNGEIVLLGRLHGVPTPVNELLQRKANEMARQGTPPGSVSPDQFLALLDG